MQFETESLKILAHALEKMGEGFSGLPPSSEAVDLPRLEAVIMEAAERMQDNYPYFHPLYAGQMNNPPHPVARLAYMLSLYINPNNHALDGGKASSYMEKEAVAEIAGMFGWQAHLGHLTGGGTMANLEALWVSGRLNPGKVVLASAQAHYTHSRISEALGLKFESVPCDTAARMDLQALEERLQAGDVGTLVATIGATGVGSVDPLPGILALQKQYGFRLHADAAYGGYFNLAGNLAPQTRAVYQRLGDVDSIVVDPHKHGLQPYGCGCILFKDPSVGRFYKHESPYTYFTSHELHLGEISLECSRAGASAVALWATQKLLPMTKGGEFAKQLEKSHQAALELFTRVKESRKYQPIVPPELDILVWAPVGTSASQISARSELVFQTAAEQNLHLATFRYPSALLEPLWPDVDFDQEMVTCLRSCLMKPEHLDWVNRIWQILDVIETG